MGKLCALTCASTLFACGEVNNNPAVDAGSGSDGSGARQPGEVVWVRSASASFGLGIAAGAAGLIYSADIDAPTNLGGDMLTPKGAADLVIGDFMEDDASHVYSVRIGQPGPGSVYGFLSQTDSAGNPIIYGVSYGNVDLGKGGVSSGGGTGADGFIGRYGPNAPSWVDRIVGTGEEKILSTTLAPGGDIYALGWYDNAATWNGATLPAAGDRDLFIAKLNSFTGAVTGGKTFGGPGRDQMSAGAGDGTSLVVSGSFNGTINFAGAAGSISPPGAPAGLATFVTKLDASLNGVWAKPFAGAGDSPAGPIALDAQGDVYVAGSFNSEIAFGAVNLTPAGGYDTFLVKLRGDTGQVAWAVKLGSANDDGPSGLVVDRGGHPVVIGNQSGDAVIASFEPDTGHVRWQKVIATAGTDYGWAITVGVNGDLFAVVDLGGPCVFDVPLIGPAAPASVIMRIAP